MGFYFRKSKSIGPFRLNFSKSGVGVSTGVKGARVSFGPKGTYVNVGKGGLYYRKKLGGKKRAYAKSPKGSQHAEYVTRTNYEQPLVNDQFQNTRVFDNPTNESDFGISIRKDIKRSKVVLWLWIVVSLALLCLIKAWAIPAIIAVPILFFDYFVARIDYDLDEKALYEWGNFSDALFELSKCEKLWLINNVTYNANTRTTAGAYKNVNRNVISIKRLTRKYIHKFRIKTDVNKILLESQQLEVLFLPSDVLVKIGKQVYSYPYDQIRITDSTVDFIEHFGVEKDAEIVQMTWQYVNKDGSPDRRYNGNRQYPVCRLGVVNMDFGGGLKIELNTSNRRVVTGLGDAFRRYRSYVMSLPASPPVTDNPKTPEPLKTADIYRKPVDHIVPAPSEPEERIHNPELSEEQKTTYSPSNEALSKDQFADLFSISEDGPKNNVDDKSPPDPSKAIDDIMNFFE